MRAVGSGHSFSTVADTKGDLVTTEALPRRAEIDPGGRTALLGSGLRYGESAAELHAAELHAAGLGLAAMGSLPHTVAARHPRFDDFRRLIDHHDPAGVFTNAFTVHYIRTPTT